MATLKCSKGVDLIALRWATFISILGFIAPQEAPLPALHQSAGKPPTPVRFIVAVEEMKLKPGATCPGAADNKQIKPPCGAVGLRIARVSTVAAHEHPRQHHRGASSRAGRSPKQKCHRRLEELFSGRSHRRQAPSSPRSSPVPATKRAAIARTLAMQARTRLFCLMNHLGTGPRKWSMKSYRDPRLAEEGLGTSCW